MESLWAPWRIDYLVGPKEKGCIFCKYPDADQKHDRQHLILYRGKTCFVIMNKYPYMNAHLMVVPFQHTNDLSKLDSTEQSELMDLTAQGAAILKESVFAQGINIGMNLGAAAGAGIKEHLHMHLVPRWEGDTNFLPILGNARVMVEHLDQTYERLLPHFEKL